MQATGSTESLRPLWQTSLLLGAAALAANLAILFIWQLIPTSADWVKETMLSVFWLIAAATLTKVTNLTGYFLALRGLQESAESRVVHFIALLLNGLFPGVIILMVYFANRSGLLQYFFG